MVRALLLAIMLLGTACAGPAVPEWRLQADRYAAARDVCLAMDPGPDRVVCGYEAKPGRQICNIFDEPHTAKWIECVYRSVPTMYDVQRANQQGYDNIRRQVRRKWRNRAFNNRYLRYDALQSFHELSDKDHHE